ncbi:MAG TPA: hypothetical protein VN368_03075 [Candidatus Methylomirabilis sp.]|nr:hypothetical protein [Candidatus Methylomirabilis sp.]
MMKKDHVFVNITDQGIINRLAGSLDINVLNRFEYFEAVNSKNGHRYKVNIKGMDILCTCPDSKSHTCKHEIAVARVLDYFNGVI